MIDSFSYSGRKYLHDILIAYSILIIEIILVYFIGKDFATIFNFILLLGYYRSNEKNYLWFAVAFILVDAPSGLFTSTNFDKNLNMLNILDRGILFQELFFLVTVIKFLKMKSKISTFYTYGVLAILIYCILLIFIGIIFGMAWQKFLLSVRWIFPILFILVFPSIVRTIKDYIKIIYILMPFIFISIIIQVVQLFFLRDTLGNYFGGESIQDYQEQYYALNRPLFSYYIIGFILLGTTVLSYLKQGAKSKIIGAALISSLLFFFLSATRGYILASGVFILILIILNVISLRKFVFGLMFLVIVFSSTLLMEKVEILDYASFSVERLGTLIFLAEGDITAGGSLGRLTNYSPIVMQKFYEQPLVGWGFSNVYHEFANGHVGNQTLLMQSGMIGFTFYMFLFTAFFYKMWHHYRLFSLLNPMKKIFLIFMAFMVYLLIVHSSSGMYFLYGIDYSQAIPFLMASFLGLTDICLKEAFLYETRIYA